MSQCPARMKIRHPKWAAELCCVLAVGHAGSHQGKVSFEDEHRCDKGKPRGS